MPELPEVENVKRTLSRFIKNCRISHLQIKTSKIVRCPRPFFKKTLTNAKIIGVRRYGKNLILALSNSFFLIIHLGMTGQILLKKSLPDNDKHTHLIIGFKNCPFCFIYRDIRKFGYFKIISKEELKPFLERIGPDALAVNYKDFRRIIKLHKRKIKNLLLDQHLICGIGNIYCDELLFRSKIHPQRCSSALSEREIRKLYLNMKEILKEAIRRGGSSVSNYLRPDARKGSFQNFHRVYRRQGRSCPQCSGKIKRIEVAQRGTYFCPHCQKKHTSSHHS